MSCHTHLHRRLPLRCAATALMLATAAAQATVGTTSPPDADGRLTDVAYGNTGNIFELFPRLFVQGLGASGNPTSVTALNSALQFGVSLGGDGSHRLTIDYTLRNTSAVQSFSDLRFMLFANPDGGGDFLDQISETWGQGAAGDPARREGRPFDNLNGILSRFALANTLSEQPDPIDADCSAGCDATVALQWKADLLAPGEVMRVRVGLSDDGQALSSRFLTIRSVSDPDTALTFSGVATVSAVPEPATTAMLLSGLLAVGVLARRGRRQAEAA